MKTRCSGCQTSFRVTPEQLKARAGKVRCGQCQTVFNALDSLVEDMPQPLPRPAAQPTILAYTPVQVPVEPAIRHPLSAPASIAWQPSPSALPVTEAPINTPDEHEAPTEPPTASVWQDEPAPSAAPTEPPADLDPALSVLLEPTFAPTSGAADKATAGRREPDSVLDAEPTIEPLSEAQAQELGKATGLILPREMTEVPGYSKWSVGVMAASVDTSQEKAARWPYLLVATLLTLILLGQMAHRFRSELAITVPVLRPALQALSTALGTNIPLPRHVDLVSIEASDLQSDVARGNLLVLNATVRNRAAYSQAYPALEIALTDTQDAPVARRVFLPEEYLPASLRADQPFQAHTDIAVRLWIEAKDIPAAGYRIYVFYP